MENVHRSSLCKRKITKIFRSIGIVKKPPDHWIRIPARRVSRRKEA